MLTKYEEEINDIDMTANKYELVMILSPISNDNNVDKILDNIALKGIVIYKKETLGLKSLAYAINGYTKGFYIILSIFGKENAIKEVEKYIRQHKEMLKYIFVRKDD